MQVKNQICTERSSTDDPEQDDSQKKTSCFSNIKIFLVSECALMLAQGTVGAYLVSSPRTRCGGPGDRRVSGSVGLTQRPSNRRRRTVSNDAALRLMRLIITLFRSHQSDRVLRRPRDAAFSLIDGLLRIIHQAYAPSA